MDNIDIPQRKTYRYRPGVYKNSQYHQPLRKHNHIELVYQTNKGNYYGKI